MPYSRCADIHFRFSLSRILSSLSFFSLVSLSRSRRLQVVPVCIASHRIITPDTGSRERFISCSRAPRSKMRGRRTGWACLAASLLGCEQIVHAAYKFDPQSPGKPGRSLAPTQNTDVNPA